MDKRWMGAVLIGGCAMAAPAAPWAQRAPSSSDLPSIMQDENAPPPPASPAKPARRSRAQPSQQPTSQLQPDLDTADQLAPSQIQQAMPPAVAAPGRPGKRAAQSRAREDKVPAPAPGARAIACNGAFAKDSSHLKLAIAFDSRNIAFTDIDGGSVGKVQASVIYPKDAKRRLEVWWDNPGSRSDTSLIVINGQSNWIAPKGVRLGLPLTALEKLNKKPFKLKGLKDNIIVVSGWDEGALATLPGGCKIGVNMAVEAAASEAARKAASDDKDYASNDEAMRAVRPTVSEIIIGY